MAVAAWAAPAAAQTPMDLDQVRQIVQGMRTAYAGVDDYVCTFYSQMLPLGQTEMPPRQTILLKFKKPFSVYMKWIGEQRNGQEVIYVQGKWDNEMWVHTGSFPDITLCLDPLTAQSMSEARHPVHDVGMGQLIKFIAYNAQRAEANPTDRVAFWDYGRQLVHGQPSRCMEGVMPAKKDSGYYGHRARVCVSEATGLPTRTTIWDHRNLMVEDMIFADVKLNVGLTDKDFDPENPAYNF